MNEIKFLIKLCKWYHNLKGSVANFEFNSIIIKKVPYEFNVFLMSRKKELHKIVEVKVLTFSDCAICSFLWHEVFI